MKDIYYMDLLTGEEGTLVGISDELAKEIEMSPNTFNLTLVSIVDTVVTVPEPISPTATIADVYKAIRRNNEVWQSR